MPRVTLGVLVVTVVAVMGLALTDDGIVAACALQFRRGHHAGQKGERLAA